VVKFALRGIVGTAVAAVGVIWLLLAVLSPLDYWDGVNFLLQSRRLTDPSYAGIPFDAWRPRGLVALLSGLDWMSFKVLQDFPSVEGYRAFMAVIAVVFVLVWNQVNTRLWGKSAALLSTVFLLTTDLLHHYAASVLADITTGLFWGACLLVFLRRPDEKISVGRALLVGGLGSLSGMSKYHFLLLLPVMALSWTAGSFRARRMTAGWMLLGFVVTLEVGLRAFSLGDAGIWEHVGHLWRQVGVAATLKRPPEIYVDGLYHMYGPIFWTLALLAVMRSGGRFSANSRGKSALIASLALALLTQAISQRELRYLFPLLPLLLGLIASFVVKTYEQMPSSARIAWTGLWAVALLYPSLRSIRDLKVSFSAPIYRTVRADNDLYWAYFGLPSLIGKKCSKIEACIFSLATREWEYPKDQFYRSYDLGPHYEFFTHLPSELRTCAANPPSLLSLGSPDSCYVVPFIDAQVGRPYVAVIKPLGAGWTEKEKKILAAQSAHPREGVHCEGETCWTVAPFFRELPNEK